VLVTFAVNEELAPWRKLRAFRSIDHDGLQLWRTNIGETDVTAMITGMGTQAAAQAMDLMMKMADDGRYFDVCISSGLAGALREGLFPSAIIAPRTLLAEVPHADLESEQLKVDKDLRERALEAGAVCVDCLLTAGQVLAKTHQKQACSSKAQSVDMESFEIVKAANAWGARTVVLRAISDTADEDLPINFNRTLSKKNQISVGKVLVELLKNPLAIPALVRFGRQSRRAAEALTKFLDRYVERLASVNCGSGVKREAVSQ
jgi:adenosylhomocysteine nucleosidase